MQLSVVSTLYRTGAFLEEFYARVCQAAEKTAGDFEIILVNDGSPDDALARAVAIHRRDPRVSVIDLSRNFGHHKAMMTGMAHARGDLVFLIDSDLEEPPELLPTFLDVLRRENADVVYGVQRARRGGAFERLSGRIFYWLVDRLCDVKLPKNLVTARLMTKRYVRNLVRHREREVIMAGLWQITGFHQVPVEIEKHERKKPTTYVALRKMILAVDFITSFSSVVLHFVLYFGLGIAALAFLALSVLTLRYIAGTHPPEGWTSVIASVWLFGGLTIFFIGLVGVYVARIFNEVKRRPYTIVREVYRRASDGAGS